MNEPQMDRTMLTVPVYSATGEPLGEETIDPADFGGTINKQLLHEVVLMHLAARRVGTVNTRGRADVAGSGKKLFRQKGTGNARVGPKRTNKRKGGGVAFARRNRDYRYSMPKKAVRIAIRMALLSKFQDRQAIVLDGLKLTKPQTKEVASILRAIRRPDLGEDEVESVGETKAAARRRTLDRRTILFGLPGHDQVIHASVRNIDGVMVAPVTEFNTYDILKQRYLVLTREAHRDAQGACEAAGKPAPGRFFGNGGASHGELIHHGYPASTAAIHTVRAGPGAIPGDRPAADHREGDPYLRAGQRLYLRGQPAGDQDGDQDGDRDALRREGHEHAHPEPPGQAAPLSGQDRPHAELEEGHCHPVRGIPDRLLLRSERRDREAAGWLASS